MAFKRDFKKDSRRDSRRDSKKDEYDFDIKKKRKWSPFPEGPVGDIDFKDSKYLSKFISERGKILPRRITGLTARQQRYLAKAIKRARAMSLLPYISYGSAS